MKCEGADDPPCKRCEKVGRECIPQTGRPRGAQEPQNSPQGHDVGLAPSLGLHPERPSNSIVSILSSASGGNHSRSAQGTSHIAPPQEPRSVVVTRFENSQTQSLSELPSIYSTPPVDAVTEQSRYHASPRSTTSVSRKRKRNGDALSIGDNTMSPASFSAENILTKEEMKDMIQL